MVPDDSGENNVVDQLGDAASNIMAADPTNAADQIRSGGIIETLGNQDKVEDEGASSPNQIIEKRDGDDGHQSLFNRATPQGSTVRRDSVIESRDASELDSNTFDRTAHLKVMAITWNMQGQMPTYENLDELFQKDNVHHDMYAFGSQEAIRPIAQSMFMPSKERLNQMVLEYFSDKLPEQVKMAAEKKDQE